MICLLVSNRVPLQARKLLSDARQPGQVQKLQLEAFWGRHSRKVLVLGGAVVVYLLWYIRLIVKTAERNACSHTAMKRRQAHKNFNLGVNLRSE